MVTLIAFLFISLLVSIFVVNPIINRRQLSAPQNLNGKHSRNELLERKNAIYAAIKDIEFDFEMGKLSDEDYQELRQKYKAEAVEILKLLDPGRSRTAKKAGGKKQAAPEVAPNAKFCWSCGSGIAEGNIFCSHCGARLQQAQN